MIEWHKAIKLPRILTHEEKYAMSTRDIQSWASEASKFIVKDFPSQEQDAILSLSSAMKASALGGEALMEEMRDVKAFLRVQFGMASSIDKRIVGDIQLDTLRSWTIAMRFFIEHAKLIQIILKRKLGDKITAYMMKFYDREERLELFEEGGKATFNSLLFQSTSSNPRAISRFGNTLFVLEIPTDCVYADSRISPLFIDSVESEIFVICKEQITGRAVPSNLDKLFWELSDENYPKTIDDLEVIELPR